MRVGPRRAAGWLALLLAGSALTVGAQGAPRPEAYIKWRQSAYQLIGWTSGRLKAALAGKAEAQEIAAAARTLAALADSGLPGLFPPGTATGKGWRDTTARDAIWSDAAGFRALNDEFAREARQLAQLAAGSDVEAVRDQFQKVARTCKSCHDKYRQTD